MALIMLYVCGWQEECVLLPDGPEQQALPSQVHRAPPAVHRGRETGHRQAQASAKILSKHM